MKKLLAMGIAVLAMTTSVFAGTDVNVKVNDKDIDAKGIIIDGRTLVPVRGIFEELGYNVSFDAETKTALLSSFGVRIKITAGQDYFTVNNTTITPDVPQQIVEGRFMLPLRAVGEAINYKVDWDAETKTASVKKNVGLKIVDTLDLSDTKNK